MAALYAEDPGAVILTGGNMQLSSTQKTAIKSLMSEYLTSGLFVYDGSFRRESYAYPNSVSSLNGSIEGCKYNGKYILNCGLFAQMIWMGRSISDFTTVPTTNITKAFDWGYYFDFTEAKKAYVTPHISNDISSRLQLGSLTLEPGLKLLSGSLPHCHFSSTPQS